MSATETVGELIEKLVIANIKLYHLKDKQAEAVKEIANPHKPTEHYLDLLKQDIELCQARARLRREIDRRLDSSTPTYANIKHYGSDAPIKEDPKNG